MINKKEDDALIDCQVTAAYKLTVDGCIIIKSKSKFGDTKSTKMLIINHHQGRVWKVRFT